jgi:perosamine synthetase
MKAPQYLKHPHLTPVPDPVAEVPFMRPCIQAEEIGEVVDSLRSGWLTTGPKTRRFESDFASFVGAQHAIAVNSCTAALHLAIVALGVRRGQAVLLPTMTFAATAEVLHYEGLVPILVDCDPVTGNIDISDAEEKLARYRRGELPVTGDGDVVGIIPVHVGGLMADMRAVNDFAERHGLWVVEDAAHSLPAAWRETDDAEWIRCGQNTSSVTCYSFYANKTITTGEGGMAVTASEELAEKMRLFSLHGLSRDAWDRYSGGGSWDYQILEPGFKYNMTDVAAALGIHQLARAESMRLEREAIAEYYLEEFKDVEEISLPPRGENRIHSWHLFPIRLNLEKMSIDRNTFVEKLRENGVGFSVHWRPLHLHPYYAERQGWKPEDLPVTTEMWTRLVSLPIFQSMTAGEMRKVVETVRALV